MGRTGIRVVIASCLVAACCTLALALGADHPKEQPVSGNEGWPTGLVELLNYKARCGGFFVNADDYFYFRADTKTFNAFLKQYAALEGPNHRLVLHPGRGTNRRPWGNDDPKPVDWRVDVVNRAWRAAGTKDKKDLPTGHEVTIHLWLGGNVPLADLDVPLTVAVESGREIETFVADHEAKQSLLNAKPGVPDPDKNAKPPSPASKPEAEGPPE